MNNSLSQMLRDATRLTRAGHLGEATAAIQRALRWGGASAPAAPPTADADVVDIEARVVDAPRPRAAPSDPAPPLAEAPQAAPHAQGTELAPPAASPAREATAPGAAAGSDGQAPSTLDGLTPGTARPRNESPAPPGRFLSSSFTAAAGTRPYKLFVPGNAKAQPRPLLVLLHGCKQNPDDFAAGTRMNELAQAEDWVVLYPAQPPSANGSSCWNWFQAADQHRERGEPAILAEMARHIIATENIDPQRVYVAGLSAGGAMAAILASTHPELFAAVGIHSGLPLGAAHDLMSALTAMRKGPSDGASVAALPAIVFHGDRDQTVHPRNGEALVAEPGLAASSSSRTTGSTSPRVETGKAGGGHRYTRSIHLDSSGRTQAEHWLVHGAGHAWSGGSAAGSYTDPKGPDASAEMLRFFSAYRVAAGSAAGAA
ncbi:PHB depolymerase family esterase [Methylibium sp.]|uniref:extracellular catalytic domain type 1 short-chain-length polyhydroxyalkanoate depolymerase n=1 Tax=Methylibium sp. TaxID=2067992 RepID=UPI0025FD8EAF|nr:PHB depolymerase family esterase [Methylibium sp.]